MVTFDSAKSQSHRRVEFLKLPNLLWVGLRSEILKLFLGNRVLRSNPKDFPPERFLRVSFRDDDWSQIQANIGKDFITRFVKTALHDGIIVAG